VSRTGDELAALRAELWRRLKTGVWSLSLSNSSCWC